MGSSGAKSAITAVGPVILVNGGVGYLNTWADGNVAGAGNPGYYLDALGVVRLTGILGGAGAADTAAFTLPAQYRPATDKYFQTAGGGATFTIRVNANGNVLPHVAAAVNPALDGCQFGAGL